SLEREWEAKNVLFSVDLPEIKFTFNEGLLREVWANLIGNAIKFSFEGGEIRINAETLNDEIRVKISDDGKGINAEAIEHVFDKFYQADEAHKEHGNGLGLPLVKKILDFAGGNIYVESTEGKGSAFTVVLPLNG
ncbi:MAG: ATP-binding protein, partial [Clostridia bacterium]|nr:ATP-binding protein [Clostridia bacterium]